tara:strand:- start:5453 stop:6217 length:765 start_codon:yes stop_codon:yes gene_type:complete
MASRIDVESGNPYRDSEGHFGTSPNAKLKAALYAVHGKKFVPKGSDRNAKKIASKKQEAMDKLAALRGNGSIWKPSGTADEANTFAKDSKVKDTLFHGTNSTSADGIKESGFDTGSSRSDKMFGDGVYLAGDKEVADWYADKASDGSSAVTLKMRINVQNPYIEDINDFSHKVGKYGVNKFTFDLYQWGIKEKKWKNPEGYEKKTATIEDYNKITREFANHLLEEHDAIIQNNSKGVELMVVKDPKNIMVVEDE